MGWRPPENPGSVTKIYDMESPTYVFHSVESVTSVFRHLINAVSINLFFDLDLVAV